MRQACRTPSGETSHDSPSSTACCDTLVAKASERPSEDASERPNAKAQDLNLPVVPHVIPIPRAAASSASGPMETENGGAQVHPTRDDHVPIVDSGSEQSR